MSRPIFPVATELFYVQLTYAITTQFLMSRQDFFAFVLKLLSRPRFSLFSLFLCRDLMISMATSKHLLSLKSVATLTLLIATRLVHPLSILCRDLVFLSRPKLLFQHLFCLNKLFHVAEVSVTTEESSVATYILPSVQHYVVTQIILFPTN